jgi:hypothetical protein
MTDQGPPSGGSFLGKSGNREIFDGIGKFYGDTAKNRWEVLEITQVYDNAINIEYQPIHDSR